MPEGLERAVLVEEIAGERVVNDRIARPVGEGSAQRLLHPRQRQSRSRRNGRGRVPAPCQREETGSHACQKRRWGTR